MGQSQSNANRQLQENDAKIQKIKTLINSADPKDRAILDSLMTKINIIVGEIETERAREENKTKTNKIKSDEKIRFLDERLKRFKNVKDEKNARNRQLSKNIAASS